MFRTHHDVSVSEFHQGQALMSFVLLVLEKELPVTHQYQFTY